jgi:NAD(P)-dependent dehydrogenase (short-subunit alcohol dehydrogenase family)
MDISASTPVVTGAARGLGSHLVDALLERGAARVYALARDPRKIRRDPRVVPFRFDLLDTESILAAADRASEATLLINNASTADFAGPIDAGADAVEHEMAVNYGGTYATIRAFAPVIEANGGGQIVNVLSLLALASAPPMTGYSASKAAAHSLTQAMRPILAQKRIRVHGVYPGGIDTDMLAGIDAPKTAPARVAAGILDALADDIEDIFPDPNAQAIAEVWWSDPKSFERAFSGMAAA